MATTTKNLGGTAPGVTKNANGSVTYSGSGGTVNLSSSGKVTKVASPSGGGTSVPAYNAKTGATTGKPSAEYDAYLTSLNKKGSPNYVPEPTAQGDTIANANILKNLQTTNPSLYQSELAKLNKNNQPPASISPTTPTVPISPTTPTPTAQVSPTKQGFDTVKSTGIEAPKTMGEAQSVMNNVVPKPAPQEVSPIGNIMETDKNFDNILTDYDKWMEPMNQTKSLLDEYQAMSKSLGINKINDKLINAEKVINGTEDDIRKEVQAVGGFATDSQVMAMANARNKSLVQNYNTLLATRDNAMQQLNTMMNLSIQDRQMAQVEFDRKLNFAFKVQEFKDKALNNAREGYNNVVKAMGYDGLYKSLVNSGDPTALATAEKTLGLSSGQLKNLASQPNLDRQIQQQQLTNQRLQGMQLQQNLNGGINGVNEKTISKIQSSPEYKTINGILPAIQALSQYKNAINKYGTFESLSGQGKGELAGSYGNALATWKTLAGLGALSGADFSLAENAVPETGFFKRNTVATSKLDSSINNAISQAENLTKRLSQNYPQASNLLQQQLDEMKVSAYPNKFKVGSDGQVYELTDVK